MPISVYKNVTVSEVLSAMTKLRLFQPENLEVAYQEEVISKASGVERDTIMKLPTFYSDSLKYGIGGHFCYWRGLVHEKEEAFDLASEDFHLARKCGVSVPKRE